MPEGEGHSKLAIRLREEFLPSLAASRDPDALSSLLERLAQCLNASGGVLWSVEEEHTHVVATCGIAGTAWAEANSANSLGAWVCREKCAGVADGEHAPYAPAMSGQSLGRVMAFPVDGTDAAIELWWLQGTYAPQSAQEFLPAISAALREQLAPLLALEAERRNYVNAISRLMMLYDIGKVFHSTLDLDELAPVICSRVLNILEAESAAVWLLDPVKKNLYCAASEGARAEGFGSVRIWASDPGLGAAVSGGETVLRNDVSEDEWAERWGGPLHSLAAVPLLQGGKFLGAIEAVRGDSSPYFTEEDLRLLIDVSKQAAVSLRNAQRLQAERRVNELNALMEISKEISATLDLDRVLTTTVNRITSVIPCDRCSVALLRKGRWEVSALSGEMKVDRQSSAVRALETMHEWLGGAGEDIIVTQTAEGVDAETEEIRRKFAAYFETAGMSVFAGFLLRDEEGVLGALVLEAKEPGGLTHSHADLARIFATQVAVAVRNALLYSQMPLVGVLQPLAEKKAKLAAMPAVRRNLIVGGIIAALAFLVFFPWQAKSSGEARALPAQVLSVGPEVEGVIRRVFVREGETVRAGDVLAELSSEDFRVGLEQAQSQYEIVSRRAMQLEAEGNLGAARLERARLRQVAADRDLYQFRLERSQVRSPISGVVMTPRMEQRTGHLLKPGDVLCQIADVSRAWVEVAVPEGDIGYVAVGQVAWLKLNTYPTRRYEGRVIAVSPQGREQDHERVFDVIVEVPNAEQEIRAGMLGRGKVLTRYRPVGYLLLRPPVRWLWLKVWNWLP
jgi:RND family efflux transporter MFP subunit